MSKVDGPQRFGVALGGAAVLAVVALASACASTSGGTSTATGFVFTPVPYKYVPVATQTAIPLSGLSTQPCDPFVADEVLAFVDAGRIDDFHAWADDIGFSRKSEYLAATGTRYNIVLGVPLGSVPAAVAAVREAPGVVEAGKNGIAFLLYPSGSRCVLCDVRARSVIGKSPTFGSGAGAGKGESTGSGREPLPLRPGSSWPNLLTSARSRRRIAP